MGYMTDVPEEYDTDCDQVDCHELAEFTYQWPGKGVMKACGNCARKAERVMGAMGYPLPLLPWKGSNQL